MNNVPPGSLRYEIKFGMPSRHWSRMEAWLFTHPLGLSVQHPMRRVNNIYFDTHALDDFHRNLAGISERSKARLRWYGATVMPEVGVFEIKYRRNATGWKRGVPVRNMEYRGGTWQTVRAGIRRQLPNDLRCRFDFAAQAVLLNTYERRYFATSDGEIRITVDENHTAYNVRHSSTPRLTRAVTVNRDLVVELKFPVGARRRVAGWMGDIPGRPVRQSKYVIGVQTLLSKG